VRYLSIAEVVELHRRILIQSGGATGVRDRSALESSIGQPLQTFGGEDLYPSVVAKSAALGFFLISNHPFVDGNKRIGHAALEVTLFMNGAELNASVDEQEKVILGVASGAVSHEQFAEWVERHTTTTGA
jgi:death-on-curing protein